MLQLPDNGVGADKFAGFNNLLARNRLIEHSDIVDNASGIKIRLLLNKADYPVQRRLRNISDIRLIDSDAALLHVIESAQQTNQRAFSSSGRSYNANKFT
ncbi:hypothetical protein D3C80_1848630 [compost metagenome]